MKIPLKYIKYINITALLFLLFGAYGLPITGFLQVVAATLFLFLYPKNKLIYVYFIITGLFFCIWNGDFNWTFLIPIFLIFFLTYIIHFYNRKLNSFLTANWKNLALINYEVDPKILEKYLPKGTEIDLYEGKCYVSLVGFLFLDTKLLGLKIPFHINFEEVNLRFYVKRFETLEKNNEWKRGVVFIKEIVPKHALTLVANTIYKEHYQTLPMKHSITLSKETTDYVYQWNIDNKWNSMEITAKNVLLPIEENTEADFICEHYFGYTKLNESTTFEYEVKHPRWEQYPVIDTKIDVDFEKVYGSDFAHLKNIKPSSVILARGSEISVENKRTIS
ncbi:YqjF family protein [Flavobacterium sp.]|uniref:YqjF family protein n=1 Tax=Flavobacterium sp. TaxID=239 RepID=UPI004048C070